MSEALHLPEKQERSLSTIVESMRQEYQAKLDTFSQDVMLAQLDVLLTYSERFYRRQFITQRKANHHDPLLSRLEKEVPPSAPNYG